MKLTGNFIISVILVIFLIPAICFINSCKKESEKVLKVRIDNITDISIITAKANATVLDIGNGIDQHGHCWSTNSEPDYLNNINKTENGVISSPGKYSSNLTGLLPNTEYFVIAYVKKGSNIVYSEDVLSFTTLQTTLPVVTKGIVDSVSVTHATVTGYIENMGTGSLSVSDHGHCWSVTTSTPTIDDVKTSLGPRDSTGYFTTSRYSLSPATTYIVRAYATNDAGTSYSDTLRVRTLQVTELPTIETVTISAVTSNSAQSGGNISSDGGAPITAKGVCWSTSQSPATSDNLTDDGTGSASFVSLITDLNASTTYYVRAYATNSEGTTYGNQLSFKTLEIIDIPTVTTTVVSDITTTSAVSGGNVISDGGASVTAKGVCWSTNPEPATDSDHTTDGIGTGIFTSNITGLDDNTKYYVRAYAINSSGTGYGEQVSFTTEFAPCDGLTAVVYSGQTYNTVIIGNQCWLAENLNVGERIDGINESYDNSVIEKYCYDDLEENCDITGGYYQWDEAMNYQTVEGAQGICPSGWHIPTDEDWQVMELYLGMSESQLDSIGWRGTDQGTQLKEGGSTGFNALLGGGRYFVDGSFIYLDVHGYFWTSTEHDADSANYRVVTKNWGNIYRDHNDKPNGLSVRCIKD